MTHDEFVAAKREELAGVARKMLSGEMKLIEGIRLICSLRNLIDDPENDVFLPIRGIDSETDHFPIGSERSNWTTASLKKMDDEMENYIADAKDDILRLCREILQIFSKH